MTRVYIISYIFVLAVLSFVLSTISLEKSQAFECVKASTPTENAICARADLKAQDDAMSRIYHQLRKNMPQTARRQLLSAQQNWLAYRASICEANSDCLLEETQLWTSAISTLKPDMVPVFIWQKGNRAQYNIRLRGVRFSQPANRVQQLFNDELDKLLANVPFKEVLSPDLAYIPSHEINWEITRFNKNLLSASISTANYSGAHPMFYQDAININVKTGTLLDTKVLFSRKAIDDLTTSCRDQIIAVKYETDQGSLSSKRQQIEKSYPGIVRQHILSMREWSFGQDGDQAIEIRFDKYQIGVGSEVPYQCYFSNEEVKMKSRQPALFEE